MTAEQVATVIAAVIWPVTVLGIVLVLREPLRVAVRELGAPASARRC